jgi:hypothetical protein
VYPGPFDLHTNEVLVRNTVNEVVPQIIKALTTPIKDEEAAPDKSKDKKGAQQPKFTGTLDEVNRYFSDNGWSDGMAVIPPTPERVEKFLKYTGYAPDQEIAVFASSNLRATPGTLPSMPSWPGCARSTCRS